MPGGEQLSGTIVVIIIAVCVQGCIMLFIFAKRQIMRFALRNRRGPHTHIGQGAPKPLRRRADRYLEYVSFIRHEPKVCVPQLLKLPSSSNAQPSDARPKDAQPSAPTPPSHYHRAKALELFSAFERELIGYSLNYTRLPGTSVRAFLLKCVNGPLLGVDNRQVQVVCDDYEHARHHHEPFGEEKLQAFSIRIENLRNSLQANKLNKPHPSPMPVGYNSPHKRRRGGGGGGGQVSASKGQMSVNKGQLSASKGQMSGDKDKDNPMATVTFVHQSQRRGSKSLLLPSAAAAAALAGANASYDSQSDAV